MTDDEAARLQAQGVSGQSPHGHRTLLVDRRSRSARLQRHRKPPDGDREVAIPILVRRIAACSRRWRLNGDAKPSVHNRVRTFDSLKFTLGGARNI